MCTCACIQKREGRAFPGMCISATFLVAWSRILALHFDPKVRPPPPSVQQCCAAALPSLQWPPPPTPLPFLSPSYAPFLPAHLFFPTHPSSSHCKSLIHDRRPSPHTPTPFTAPSPLYHRTLPQYTPLRWISPAPSTFWLPSQPLLPCTTAPSLSTLPYAEYHPLRPHSDSLHSPFSPAPPHPPSAHSLTLNITRSVHILTPFTAPSPLHHRTLPQHTPLRWISPTPSTFWLPSQPLLPCTTAPSLSTLPYAECHPLRPHSDSLHSPFSPAPPHPPSAHSLTLNITRSVHILTPFTAPSPLHHRTLPQHTPLRWISPAPSTFWLPSHPLLPCTTAPSLSTLPYTEYHPLRPHSAPPPLHSPSSPAPPHPPQHTPLHWISPAPSTFWLPSQPLLPCTTAPPSAHSLTLNITRSVHILTPFTAPSPLHHRTLPQHTPLRWISPAQSTFWLPSQPLLPCTTASSLSTLPYAEYHPLRPHSDSLHSPFSPAPPHPPSAHSLTLNTTRSVELPTRSADSGWTFPYNIPPTSVNRWRTYFRLGLRCWRGARPEPHTPSRPQDVWRPPTQPCSRTPRDPSSSWGRLGDKQ